MLSARSENGIEYPFSHAHTCGTLSPKSKVAKSQEFVLNGECQVVRTDGRAHQSASLQRLYRHPKRLKNAPGGAGVEGLYSSAA